jgi:hypothetical protein
MLMQGDGAPCRTTLRAYGVRLRDRRLRLEERGSRLTAPRGLSLDKASLRVEDARGRGEEEHFLGGDYEKGPGERGGRSHTTARVIEMLMQYA